MELEFLGTGAGVPARQRNVTSIALNYWMNGMKCGYSTLVKQRNTKFLKQR